MDLLSLLDAGKPILADGAMGTMLHGRGITFEGCFDELNLTRPALVADIHRSYLDAGAQIIKTNTFGANRYKLVKHGLQDKVADINTAAVELARRVAFGSFRDDVLVAGDVGPLGIRLAPFGRVQPEEAHEGFCEQITALTTAGVDLLLIETQSDIYEIRAAVQAARQLAPSLPIIASVTFTRDDRTLLGDGPAKVAHDLQELGVDVIGINCSSGPAQLLRLLKAMRQAAPTSKFSVMPNAGWPETVGGRIMYPSSPEYFGDYAILFWEAGANIIGGCCGTTPQHIQVLRRALDATTVPVTVTEVVGTDRDDLQVPAEGPTQFAQKLAAGKFAIAVEMDPPRGLSTHKILAGASLLAEAGADVINVADSPMARMRMSPWAVCSVVQEKVGVETTLHFPTRGRNLLRVQGDLLAAHALGVRNVFVVMGDPTSIGDYPEAMDNYDLVPSGLIKLIKQNFNAGLDHAGSNIGQPTSFFVGGALNLNPADPDTEIKNLRRKLRAGVDFLLTMPIYEPGPAQDFLVRYAAEHGPLPVPILAGILPLFTYRHASFLNNEVPGISIPAEALRRMEAAGENGPAEGRKIALELIEQIRPLVQGIYLMPPFNRFDHAAEIIDAIHTLERA